MVKLCHFEPRAPIGVFSGQIESLPSGNLLHSELENPPILNGKITIFNGKINYFYWENHHLLMAKSTISTGPCSMAFCMFTRGYVQ